LHAPHTALSPLSLHDALPILMTLATCAVLETAIAFRQQRVIMWPASALLTGNGMAFVLRVPGTHHGDWWSTRGWWIFVGTAAVSDRKSTRLNSSHVAISYAVF